MTEGSPGQSADRYPGDQNETLDAPEAPASSKAPPAASRYEPGDRIADRYRLLRPLARGGMGEVWIGVHENLRTEVALKFLHGISGGDEDMRRAALERFRFEAQVSARIGGATQHTVGVHDAGLHAGDPYLVMELVRGHTLEAELERNGVIAPERLAAIFDQIAEALGVAHSFGIVHRDLKPSNIMIVEEADGDLLVKVADFGVAKAVTSELQVDRPTATGIGYLVGSPGYMSPEQIGCDTPIDARSDFWALGVVAYEALTGFSAFNGNTVAELIVSISTRAAPPPSGLRPSLPTSIDVWFERALAKDPDARFASAEELASTFRAAISAPEKKKPNPAVLAAAAVAACVLLASAVTFYATRGAPVVEASAAPRGSAEASAPAPVRPEIAVTPTEATSHAPGPSVEVQPPTPSDRSSPPPARTAVARPKSPTATPAPAPAPAPSVEPVDPPRPRKEINPSEIQ